MVKKNQTERLERTQDGGLICTSEFGKDDIVFVVTSNQAAVVGNWEPKFYNADFKFCLQLTWMWNKIRKGKALIVVPASPEWERVEDRYVAKLKKHKFTEQVCEMIQKLFGLPEKVEVLTRGSGHGNVLVEFGKSGNALPKVFVENASILLWKSPRKIRKSS